MSITKKQARYRPGSTCGGNNCERCVCFTGTTWWCSMLEARAEPSRSCDYFREDPDYVNPYADMIPCRERRK